MRSLRKRFENEVVVIGVHSAKFTAEGQTHAIAQAAKRMGITHPVVNDAAMAVWDAYAVRAWPTLVVLDATGRIAAQAAGEIDVEEVAGVVQALVDEAAAAGTLDRTPVAGLEPPPDDDTPLRYPARLVTAPGGRLFVSDTGHHRILEVQLSEDGLRGAITRQFGTGAAGLADGASTQAQFDSPHGLAFVQDAHGSRLYVADTGNHAIRKVDLVRETVTTLAGTGAKGSYRSSGATLPTEIPLRSPWAVLPLTERALLIAMAGSHQLWLYVEDAGGDPAQARLGLFAGTGAEALVDGPRAQAAFNQPSDLALCLGHVIVADAEASAIRAVWLTESPQVVTLVGQGLFAWGDVDGVGNEVRLQHPVGLCAQGANQPIVYIADSYNHKVKVLAVTSGQVRTLVGTGAAGMVDGDFEEAMLDEPQGLALSEDGTLLYIADTNNHSVRVADLATGRVSTLQII